MEQRNKPEMDVEAMLLCKYPGKTAHSHLESLWHTNFRSWH
ncbi:Uncharacterised protein [Serratia marcescens]|nr:Uncharacterised protein [Serratia marcescens]CVD00874.1 Uncharacterised protein [Serratia sp. 2880STDY5682894]CUZ03236.1 Uncharacterised protein [Serratia marcescens]CUZ74599.1 Uncharacterised protein [Serratia marcescens]CUZ91414.1 Uncharacterised protein [Serratia marcescens]